jgi:hypothetical protein
VKTQKHGINLRSLPDKDGPGTRNLTGGLHLAKQTPIIDDNTNPAASVSLLVDN